MSRCLVVTLFFISSIQCFSQDKSASDFIDEAYELNSKEDYNGAIGVLNRAIIEMPDSAVLFMARGTFMDAYQLDEEAISDYTKAIEMSEDNEFLSVAYSNRGGSKNKIRDFNGAIEDLTKSIESDTTNINALNNLSIVYGNLDRKEESIKYLNQIIQVDKNYLPAYINLGFIHQGIGKHKKALEYFDTAIKMDPDAPLAYSNRSFSRLKTGNTKGALKDINKSLKMLPSNSYAYKLRALILIEKGEMEEVCGDLERAELLGYTKQFGTEVKELTEKHCK